MGVFPVVVVEVVVVVVVVVVIVVVVVVVVVVQLWRNCISRLSSGYQPALSRYDVLSAFPMPCDGLAPEVISVFMMPQCGSVSRCKEQKKTS